MTIYHHANVRRRKLFCREAGSKGPQAIAFMCRTMSHPSGVELLHDIRIIQALSFRTVMQGIGAAFDPMKPFWANQSTV